MIPPPDKEIKSSIKLVDSNHEDAEGDKSGFLLFNNEAVCADTFTTSLSATICQILGYLNSQGWKARENGRSLYEINFGSLTCNSPVSDMCILQDYNECRTGFIVFLFCTGRVHKHCE